MDESGHMFIETQDIIQDYLDDLVKTGLHGGTREEVAEYLIRLQLLRLVKEGFIKVRSKDAQAD